MKTLGKLKTLGLATVLTGAAVAGSIVVAQSVTPNQSTQEQGQQGRFGPSGLGVMVITPTATCAAVTGCSASSI
jgi:hypothetical protein